MAPGAAAKWLAQPMLKLMAGNFREIQVVPRGFSLTTIKEKATLCLHR